MKVEVLTPDQYMGDVTGDLNRRRGMLEGMDSKHGVQVIKAKVPLSEMFGYVTQLRSLSSGRATSTLVHCPLRLDLSLRKNKIKQ